MVSSNSANSHVKNTVKRCLDAFATVPRFGTLLMFLSRAEKEKVAALFKSIDVETVDNVWKAVL
jgi:hypothetical protein